MSKRSRRARKRDRQPQRALATTPQLPAVPPRRRGYGYDVFPSDLDAVSSSSVAAIADLLGVSARRGPVAVMQQTLGNPWLATKVWRIASAAAMLRFRVLARVAGRPQPVELPQDYPLAQLLHKPNPVLAGYHVRLLTSFYLRTAGGCSWLLRRDGLGVPRAMFLVPPHWLRRERPKRAGDDPTYTVRNEFGLVETVGPRDLIRFRRPDPLDPYNQDIGDAAAFDTELRTYERASESDLAFFDNDATPPIALRVDGSPDDAELDRIREVWMRRHQGHRKHGVPGILVDGTDIKELASSRQDMQFVEGQRWLRDVLIAGVPPHILGIDENANRASATVSQQSFGQWEVRPDVEYLTEVLNNDLAPQFDRRAYVEFESPVPVDAERHSAEALNAGAGVVMTRDERRARLGLPPLGRRRGGDTFILPLNVIEVPAGTVGDAGDDDDEELPDGDETRQPTAPATRAEGKAVKITAADIVAIVNACTVDPLEKRMLPEYQRTMEAKWEDAAQEIGFDGVFDLANPAVAQYLREASSRRIVGINETTRQQIRSALEDGYNAGESIQQIADRIGEVFASAKGRRAELIAGTEVIDASAEATRIAYLDAGITDWEWLTAQDDGVCPICEPLDGLIVKIGEQFGDSGVTQPTAHPGCRCATAAVLLEDTRGYSDRQKRLEDVGTLYAKLERAMAAAVKKGMQDQQRAVLRELRARKEVAA